MKNEFRRLLLAIAGFLLVNGLTLTRYPSVWVDEVQFADPAVSFASGQGFSSTAWFAQDSTQFWAGNVPLYTGLLSGWLKLFGANLGTERSLNLVLFSLVLPLVWRWMRASGTVPNAAWRLAAVGLLMCGHGMVFSYRSGRYDVIGMLLGAMILNLWTQPIWLIALGALLPSAGLQLIPGALVLSTLAVLFGGSRMFNSATALTGGMGLGWLGLRAFYSSHGVWESFRSSTSAIGLTGQSILGKVAGLPGIYLADKSRGLVAVALLIALVTCRAKLSRPTLKLTGFVIAASVLLPAALQLAGKFPVYYGWMVFIPLVIAMAHVAEQAPKARIVYSCLLIVAALAGLPLRLACAVSSYADRSPARLQSFVRGSVPSGAVILADFKAYYAVRAEGVRPLLPTYVPALRTDQRLAVDFLIVRPEEALGIETRLGGEWRATGDVFPAPATPGLLKTLVAEMREEAYPLAVYRRNRHDSKQWHETAQRIDRSEKHHGM